jgi:hypothetical protein
LAASLDAEKSLLSKIVLERSLIECAEIQDFFFTNDTVRKGFQYIRQHYSEFGEVPTPREFKLDNPECPILAQVDEGFPSLTKRVQDKYILGVLNSNIDAVAKAVSDGKVEEAVNFLGMTLTKVHTTVVTSKDVDVTENGHERLERYLERRNNPGSMLGIPSGFKTLDKATLGFQKGQLITLTGLAKASKSTVAMLMAMAAQQAGFKVLYCTYEMSVEEQERRLDAYRAGFNDNKLNSGNFTEEELKKLKQGMEITASLPKMIISQDCMTISALNAKIDVEEPDYIVIDGAYLMDDEYGEPPQSPGALTHIVKGLHNIVMRKSKVVLAVTQSTPARTKGEVLNTDSIMGSRAFVQYSYCVIGIERTEDVCVRHLKIIMGRSYAPCDVMIKFDYDTADFSELKDYDPDDDLDRELAEDSNYELYF